MPRMVNPGGNQSWRTRGVEFRRLRLALTADVWDAIDALAGEQASYKRSDTTAVELILQEWAARRADAARLARSSSTGPVELVRE